jgi:hypothetical protein
MCPTFPIGFDGGKLRARLAFGEIILAGRSMVFAGGGCDFVVFYGGKNVVSLWWIGW